MSEIKISYDSESDVLEVLFAKPSPDELALELSFNVVLFVNPRTFRALNLMILDYTQLLEMEKIHLDELEKMPLSIQRKILHLLTSDPVRNFLQLVGDSRSRKRYARVCSPRVQDLLAA